MKWGANTWVGGSLVALAVGVAVFAPWIAITDPVMDANLMNAELPPSWEFPFGTDAQGRDIYSRICYGARISLTVGVVSQICNSLIGVTLGLTAGYWGGWWDDMVSGLTNLMLAIPSLVFALAIMAILGPGLVSLVIALGLTSWSYSCRIARAQVLSLKERPFVVGVLGDFSGQPETPLPRIKDRKMIEIDRDNFDQVLAAQAPRVQARVENKLAGDGSKMGVELKFQQLADFEPDQIVQQVEPLRKLVEARRRLTDLMSKADGNDKLEQMLTDVLKSAGQQHQLADALGLAGDKKPEDGNE